MPRTNERSRPLQHNPDPLEVVLSRRVGTAERGWRCEYEDGRGRCASVETKGFVMTTYGAVGGDLVVSYFCEKHEPETAPDA